MPESPPHAPRGGSNVKTARYIALLVVYGLFILFLITVVDTL